MFQKNAITVYSKYSYSGIVPKERALRMDWFTRLCKIYERESGVCIEDGALAWRLSAYQTTDTKGATGYQNILKRDSLYMLYSTL